MVLNSPQYFRLAAKEVLEEALQNIYKLNSSISKVKLKQTDKCNDKADGFLLRGDIGLCIFIKIKTYKTMSQ